MSGRSSHRVDNIEPGGYRCMACGAGSGGALVFRRGVQGPWRMAALARIRKLAQGARSDPEGLPPWVPKERHGFDLSMPGRGDTARTRRGLVIYKRALSLSKRAIRDGLYEQPQEKVSGLLDRAFQEQSLFVGRGERALERRRKGGLKTGRKLVHQGQLTRERVLKVASELRAFGKPERGLAGKVAERLGEQGYQITERQVLNALKKQTEASSRAGAVHLSNRTMKQTTKPTWINPLGTWSKP